MKPLEEFYVRVGAVVSEMRGRLGMTQKELAAALQTDDSFVSRVERGATRLPVHEYPRLAKALRLRVIDLFPAEFFE